EKSATPLGSKLVAAGALTAADAFAGGALTESKDVSITVPAITAAAAGHKIVFHSKDNRATAALTRPLLPDFSVLDRSPPKLTRALCFRDLRYLCHVRVTVQWHNKKCF
ncbi:MAG: hypothetical protein QMB17_01235, partial [Polaromonas sp.]